MTIRKQNAVIREKAARDDLYDLVNKFGYSLEAGNILACVNEHGYRLIPELTLLSDEGTEAIVKAFWGKYSNTGLSPSEVMELQHSELWESLTRAQLDSIKKQIGIP